MNQQQHLSRWIATALAILGTAVLVNKAMAGPAGPPETQKGVEVLTRGPVHEAFAETVSFNPEPGIVVNKAPREIIEEVPPDQRPEGSNITWIPGYWGWDEDRNDFLWVSGIWRDLPPGRQWVPGYWSPAGQGNQWTSGYWADAKVREIQFLPEPPETVEVGPNIVAPSPDYVWVPGCWVWVHGRYAWRPGYWEVGRPDWDWVPAHYIWAPRGYVYSDGYWDYPVERRGVLFAPVYFDDDVYSRHGYSYSPAFAINLAVFSDSLFLRPGYQHYYFGDYYDSHYRDSGYYASYSYHSSRYGYDPIYAHRRWEHRRDDDWDRHDRETFAHRRDDVDARPPRTLLAQLALGSHAARPGDGRIDVAASFALLAKRKDGPVRYQTVDKSERDQLAKRGREIQQARGELQKSETRTTVAPNDKPGKSVEPARITLPRSPIVGKPVERLEKAQAPPQRQEGPKPDPKIEPKARKPQARPEMTRADPNSTKSDPRQQPRKPEPGAKRADPQPDQAKSRPDQPRPAPQPKAEPPKPREKPQAEPAKQERKAEPPKQERKAEPAQPGPRPQPESPKPAPKPRPESPKPAPKPDPPKTEPKEKPHEERKDQSKEDSKERPQGDSKDKPKDKP